VGSDVEISAMCTPDPITPLSMLIGSASRVSFLFGAQDLEIGN
jgi:hypothetical protein